MALVSDVLTATLREMGVCGASETPTGEDATIAFDTLNRLLDSWQAERLQIYTTTRTTFTITSGTQVYLVGTSQVVNVARPVFVDGISYLDTTISPAEELPLKEMTEDEYRLLPMKAMTTTYPLAYYYNPLATTGSITLWPNPTGTTLQGVLYAPFAVAQFATQSDAVSLPPGYQRMIVKNLALELSPAFKIQPDPLLMRQAQDSKEIVMRVNRRLSDLKFELGVDRGGRYSIFSDSYV